MQLGTVFALRREDRMVQSSDQTTPVSKKQIWTGRTLSALAILFLLFDSVIKVVQAAPAVEGTKALGYEKSAVFGIGIVELACLLLYAIPQTSVLGAILLTGYLGGAIASHARIDSPLFTHTLFPIYVAVLIWGGLLLREERLRKLVPLRR